MIRAIVLDIEGTTTRVSFVTDVLFPFARARLLGWARAHPEAPELAEVRALAAAPQASLEEVVQILLQWMDEDRKATPLKAIQGQIWQEGYGTGALLAHVYPDVPVALAAWAERGLALAVYSSGSVLAQQLLFAHSEAGDLRRYISAWFDTRVGPKREAASYVGIAASLGVAPQDVLFLSDVQAELDAATAAGLRTALIAREGGRFTTFFDVEEAILQPESGRAATA